MESKRSKAAFIIIVAFVCVIALLFAVKHIKKTNEFLSKEFNAVSDYYRALNLPTNSAGVMAKSIFVHIDDIQDGHIVAVTQRTNDDFSSNRLVWIKFEGENLQDRVRDLEAIRDEIVGTYQTVAYFTVDKEVTPHVITAYDIISLSDSES